jgi:hypothetical protein
MFDLFRDWDAVLSAGEMSWTFDDAKRYAQKTYGAEAVARALAGVETSSFHGCMVEDIRLAKLLGIEHPDSLHEFVEAMVFANQRAIFDGDIVYLGGETDIVDAAKLIQRIGWDNAAECPRLYTLFNEDCRKQAAEYLDAGVSGRFICVVPVLIPGFEAFDVEEALFLEERGVPPEYAAGFSDIVVDEMDTDRIVAMWEAGIPLEFAREVANGLVPLEYAREAVGA